MLIKIGDFAKQAGITIKTLRHYDKLGLIKPAWINRFNGYRYYDPQQLIKTKLILTYKDMGFSLGQIADLLDGNISGYEYRKLLNKQIGKLDNEIRKDQARIAKIKACLAKIADTNAHTELEAILTIPKPHSTDDQKEHNKMKVKVDHFAARSIVGMQYVGKNEHNEIGMAWTTFNQRMSEIQHVSDKKAYGICAIPAGLPEGEFEYVCGLTVDQTKEIPTGMVIRQLEEMQVAVFEHRGSYEGLGDTYSSIYQKWLPEAGLTPLKDGFDIEIYDEKFKDFAPDSVMFITVPIKA